MLKLMWMTLYAFPEIRCKESRLQKLHVICPWCSTVVTLLMELVLLVLVRARTSLNGFSYRTDSLNPSLRGSLWNLIIHFLKSTDFSKHQPIRGSTVTQWLLQLSLMVSRPTTHLQTLKCSVIKRIINFINKKEEEEVFEEKK